MLIESFMISEELIAQISISFSMAKQHGGIIWFADIYIPIIITIGSKRNAFFTLVFNSGTI